jgi:glutamine amidotransferase
VPPVRDERGPGAGKPLVVIASERMDEDAGWRLLASGELLRVTPTLEVSSRRVLAGPPARLLTLEDLEPAARASQSAATPRPGA